MATPLRFDPSSLRKIEKVELATLQLVRQILRDDIHGALVAMALQRVIRTLLNDLGDNERLMLIREVLVPFLQGEPIPGDGKIITVN